MHKYETKFVMSLARSRVEDTHKSRLHYISLKRAIPNKKGIKFEKDNQKELTVEKTLETILQI